MTFNFKLRILNFTFRVFPCLMKKKTVCVWVNQSFCKSSIRNQILKSLKRLKSISRHATFHTDKYWKIEEKSIQLKWICTFLWKNISFYLGLSNMFSNLILRFIISSSRIFCFTLPYNIQSIHHSLYKNIVLSEIVQQKLCIKHIIFSVRHL